MAATQQLGGGQCRDSAGNPLSDSGRTVVYELDAPGALIATVDGAGLVSAKSALGTTSAGNVRKRVGTVSSAWDPFTVNAAISGNPTATAFLALVADIEGLNAAISVKIAAFPAGIPESIAVSAEQGAQPTGVYADRVADARGDGHPGFVPKSANAQLRHRVNPSTNELEAWSFDSAMVTDATTDASALTDWLDVTAGRIYNASPHSSLTNSVTVTNTNPDLNSNTMAKIGAHDGFEPGSEANNIDNRSGGGGDVVLSSVGGTEVLGSASRRICIWRALAAGGTGDYTHAQSAGAIGLDNLDGTPTDCGYGVGTDRLPATSFSAWTVQLGPVDANTGGAIASGSEHTWGLHLTIGFTSAGVLPAQMRAIHDLIHTFLAAWYPAVTITLP